MSLRALPLVVCLACAGLCFAQPPGLGHDLPAPNARAARAAFRAAEKAERKNDLAAAFAGYQTAAAKDPSNSHYIVRRELARQAYAAQLIREGKYTEAYQVDPSNEFARQQQARKENPVAPAEPLPLSSRSRPPSEDTTPPLVLVPRRARRSWDLRGDTKAVYLAIGTFYGIHFDFEDELQPQRIHLEIGDSDFADAVRAAGILTKTFAAPLTSTVALVAADTSVKHQQYERQCVRVFDATEMGADAAINDVANVLRNLLEMKWVQVNLARKEILVRDEIARVNEASEIMRWLSLGQAQTVVEFQLIQVSRARMRQLGILPTQTYSVTPLGTKLGPFRLVSATNNTTTGTATNTTPTAAATFGGGGTLMALTIPSASAEAVFSDGKTRSLDSILARASDGQTAKYNIGQRYPIVTAVVTYAAASAGSATSGGIPANSVPSFNYADIGLKVEVTPHVHPDGEITLALKSTSTALGATSVNGNPTIENREFETQMRIADGESVVISGMRQQSNSVTTSGLPGLANIPALGLLFGQRVNTDSDDDLLMVVTPHIVRWGAGQTSTSNTIFAPEHTIPVLK